MHPMLTFAVKAARRAGSIINRASFDIDKLTVHAKQDADFVSEVDHAAEDAIVSTLKEAYPEHAILAEERGAFGRTVLHARDAAVPALGFVVEFSRLQHALSRRMPAATVLAGARVERIASLDRYAVADFVRRGARETITADVVVVADGGVTTVPEIEAHVRPRVIGPPTAAPPLASTTRSASP